MAPVRSVTYHSAHSNMAEWLMQEARTHSLAKVVLGSLLSASHNAFIGTIE